MNTPKGYVNPEYLQSVGNFLNSLKQRTYECMRIKVGDKVLDVGCGSGIDTMALSQIVGSTGQVFGVDYDNGMIAESEQYAEREGVSAWVKHKQADATSLSFETGYFDSCRSERLFQHLPNAELALNEMVRVTRVGGTLVVLDTDWGTLGIDTTEINTERRLTRFHAEHMHYNGFSGRQLYRLFKKQGLCDVSFEVFPLVVTNYAFARQSVGMDELECEAIAKNIITEEELHRYHRNAEQADAEGVYFAYCCMVLVYGQKTG
jgi:ubiquinone/menaquinone biosynthesis C-methylase UbiE